MSKVVVGGTLAVAATALAFDYVTRRRGAPRTKPDGTSKRRTSSTTKKVAFSIPETVSPPGKSNTTNTTTTRNMNGASRSAAGASVDSNENSTQDNARKHSNSSGSANGVVPVLDTTKKKSTKKSSGKNGERANGRPVEDANARGGTKTKKKKRSAAERGAVGDSSVLSTRSDGDDDVVLTDSMSRNTSTRRSYEAPTLNSLQASRNRSSVTSSTPSAHGNRGYAGSSSTPRNSSSGSSILKNRGGFNTSTLSNSSSVNVSLARCSPEPRYQDAFTATPPNESKSLENDKRSSVASQYSTSANESTMSNGPIYCNRSTSSRYSRESLTPPSAMLVHFHSSHPQDPEATTKPRKNPAAIARSMHPLVLESHALSAQAKKKNKKKKVASDNTTPTRARASVQRDSTSIPSHELRSSVSYPSLTTSRGSLTPYGSAVLSERPRLSVFNRIVMEDQRRKLNPPSTSGSLDTSAVLSSSHSQEKEHQRVSADVSDTNAHNKQPEDSGAAQTVTSTTPCESSSQPHILTKKKPSRLSSTSQPSTAAQTQKLSTTPKKRSTGKSPGKSTGTSRPTHLSLRELHHSVERLVDHERSPSPQLNSMDTSLQSAVSSSKAGVSSRTRKSRSSGSLTNMMADPCSVWYSIGKDLYTMNDVAADGYQRAVFTQDFNPDNGVFYTLPSQKRANVFSTAYLYSITPRPSDRLLIDMGAALDDAHLTLEASWAQLRHDIEVASRASPIPAETCVRLTRRLRSLEEFNDYFSIAAVVQADVITSENLRICLLNTICDTTSAALEILSPFACYVLAKTIAVSVLTDKTRHIVLQLLEKSVNISHIATMDLARPAASQLAIPVRTPLPLIEGVPIYLFDAWFRLGRLLEGMEEFGAVTPNVFAETQLLETHRATDGKNAFPLSLLCYRRSLELSNGNCSAAWNYLGFALGQNNGEAVVILNERVSQAQCFAEVIRCRDGVTFCTDERMWRDASGFLRAGYLPSPLSTPRTPSSSGVRMPGNAANMIATMLVNEPFLYKRRNKHIFTEHVDKKSCIAQCIRCSRPPGTMDDWLELGMTLEMSIFPVAAASKDGAPRWTVEEETVDINGTAMTRMDCFSKALQIDPMASHVWYRAALSMEDRVHLENDGCTADANVYERHLLGSLASAVDRTTAMAYGILSNPSDYRLWFALGTTLFERNYHVHQPRAMRVKVPVVQDGMSQVHDVDASDCFNVCRRLRPVMKEVIEGWIARVMREQEEELVLRLESEENNQSQ